MGAHGILRCDCGFEAVGDDGDELAAAAKAHARERHGLELTAAAITALLRARDTEPAEKEGSGG